MMQHRFPKVTYSQRWHAESGFSQHKRRQGPALTACGSNAQARELILCVLTHNLTYNFMLLAEPHRISAEHQVP
jgi:transposase